MVYKLLWLVFALAMNKSDSQTLTVTSCIKDGSEVILRCKTTDFASAILFYLNGVNKGGCTSGTCGTGITDYDTPTQSGTYTEMKIGVYDHSRDGGAWTCDYGGTPSNTYTVELGNNCISTTDGLETGPIVGIVVGCVFVAAIASAVFASYRNGLFCFATGRQRAAIEKEVSATAGSEVKLLPELTSTSNIKSVKWKHAGNTVKTGNENELMHRDGTIPWVSPNDSGLWHCNLIIENANEKNFVIRLNVTVHQYEADEGTRVQLLDYMKKSQSFQRIQWYHEKMKITGNELKYQGGTIQVPALYVGKLEEEDAGEYTCEILFQRAILEIPVKLAVKSKGNSSLPPVGTPGLNTATS